MLKKKETKKHTFSDDFDSDFAYENSAAPATKKVGDPKTFDFKAGLRRMSFEGLTDKDRVDEKQRAAIAAVHDKPCKCEHGTEHCCEFQIHEQTDLVEYFEAPTTGHRFHQAHYCISGDEPECDHLRQEEKEVASRRRAQI